jgi:hypothetical protein
MTNQHPVTPPPDKIHNWLQLEKVDCTLGQIITIAAQWGSDQELEACCEVLARELICDGKHVATDLRMIRRPKALSLKEQALALIDECTDPEGDYLDDNALSIIRRALEALPDD